MATAPSKPQVARGRLRLILLASCLGFSGLLILGLTFLPEIVALERVQRMLISHVEAALQRRMSVGAVRLQLLNGIEVTLEDATLDNPPGWTHSDFLRIGKISVQVAFLPLLQRTITITKMVVHDADLVIERDPHGQLNVADLATAAIAQGPELPHHKAYPAETMHPGVGPLLRWLVTEATLAGVTVTFVDQMGVPGELVTTSLRDVRGYVRDISRNTPIRFDLTASVLTDGERNLRVRGRIGPIPSPLAIGRAPIEADLQAADLLLGTLSPYLGERFPLVQGRVDADLKVDGRMGGNLHITSALSLVDAAVRHPTGGEAAATLPMLVSTQKITLDLANASLQIAEARLHLSSLHATLTGTVADVRSNPRLALHIATTAFDVGDLLPQIPALTSIIPAPAELQGRAELQATIAGTPRALRADVDLEANDVALKSGAIRVETDTTHVSLTAHLAEPRPPHVHLALHAHHLVVAQREASAPLLAATPPPGTTPHEPQAHTRLPPVTLNGTVEIAEGRLQHVRFQQLTAEVALAQGRLTTTHQTALYGGFYRGVAQMNLTRGEPAYTLNARVVGVQLAAAMRAWTSVQAVRQGVLTTQFKLSGQGWTWRRLRQALRGDGQVTITDFTVMPADPLPTLTRPVTIVGPLGRMTTYLRLKREAFSLLRARFDIRHGHIFSDDLQLWGEDVAIRANGYLGLDQSVSYNGMLALSGQRASARSLLAKLFLRDAHSRMVFPFSIKGMVNDPQIVVNVKDVLARGKEVLTDKPK